MSSDDSSVEVGQIAQVPEKGKWGFRIERATAAVPLRASQLGTSEYRFLTGVIQHKIAKDSYLQDKTPQFIQKYLNKHAPEDFGDTQNMDTDTFLTNVSEMFEFKTGGENVKLYNFSTPVIDEQLFQIGDALGQVNSDVGGNLMPHLSNIMILPEIHPLFRNEKTREFVPATVLSGGKMVVLSAKLFESKFATPKATVERPKTSNEGLKTTVAHEFIHILQSAYKEAAKRYESFVHGEVPPTKYAEARHGDDVVDAADRDIEDLPETYVANIQGTYVAHIGPRHAEGLRQFIDDIHSGVDQSAIVTCQQLNPETFRKSIDDWLEFGGEPPDPKKRIHKATASGKRNMHNPRSSLPDSGVGFSEATTVQVKERPPREPSELDLLVRRDALERARMEIKDRAELGRQRLDFNPVLQAEATAYKKRHGPSEKTGGLLSLLKGLVKRR